MSENTKDVVERATQALVRTFFVDVLETAVLEAIANFPDKDKLATFTTQGMTLVFAASSLGFCEVVKVLVSKYHCDPSVPTTDEYGMTPLHVACQFGHLNIVQFLVLECGCDPMCRSSKEGYTPLHYASGCGHVDIIKFLALQSSSCKSCIKEDILTLLYAACRGGHLEAVKVLFQLSGHCYSNEKTMLGSPLYDITTLYDHRYIEKVASSAHAVDQRNLDCSPFAGWTQLHAACVFGHLDIVMYLVVEQNYDPTYRAIYVGATALHLACVNGHLQIVKFLILEQHCDPECRDYTGATPLHRACHNGHLDIVKFLVLEQNCDTACKANLDLWMPLHLTCLRGQVDVAKFLILEQNCNPACKSQTGITPLHIACERGQLEMVKFLVFECKADPFEYNQRLHTPLHNAYENNYIDIVAILLTSNRLSYQALQGSYAHLMLHPAFKVFVVGNPSAGKSTLVKAVENKLTDTSYLSSMVNRLLSRQVSGVDLQTAGIRPVHIPSPKFGHVIMFDFAGQFQYYTSQGTILRQLATSPGSLILLVVDLSKRRKELVYQSQYWVSFIENSCFPQSPPVVVIGSHSDILQARGENPDSKLELAYDQLSPFSTTSLEQSCVYLNCTLLSSKGLNSVCDIIANHCEKSQKQQNIGDSARFVSFVIKQNFSDQIACRFENIANIVRAKQNSHLRDCALLPSDDSNLSEQLSILNEHGQIVYLKDNEDLNHGWVIINKEVLLSEINGTIFSPEYFKQHHNISSSTGVVPFSKIKEVFLNQDPNMIASFMTHLQFCHKMRASEASLIAGPDQLMTISDSETYYFFPALVTVDRPEETFISIGQTHYKSGWCLERVFVYQFFDPQFLHTLLLRLAFSFALSSEDDIPAPVVQRQCNVWKCGIHWQNMDGVEAIVEVVEQNTAVIVMTGCLEGGEMACVKLRSEIINTILQVRNEVCAAVEVRESLIHQKEMSSYLLQNMKNLTKFSIVSLAKAVVERKSFIVSKEGHKMEMIKIEDLLHFEPYAFLTSNLITKLFDKKNASKEIEDGFLLDFGRTAKSGLSQMTSILIHPENESELYAKRAALCSKEPFKSDPTHHCYVMLRTWKVCTATPTYKVLKESLDNYSVFCGRNPLVAAGRVVSGATTLSMMDELD